MTAAPATQRNTVRATFVIKKTYKASPARVFKAFADEQAKARWFGPDDFEWHDRKFDFRVDGQEIATGRHAHGVVSSFHAVYHDIVPNERIIYAYRMTLDGVPISSSLATIEIEPDAGGTRLTVTEHGIFLDGYDDAGSREHGTNWLMDRLGASLAD